MVLLDFDGVLFYTHDEAFYVTVHAMGNHDLFLDSEKLKADTEQHRKLFKEYRYLIGDAWHCRILLNLLTVKTNINPDLDVDSAFKEAIAIGKNLTDLNFESDFYDSREHIKKNYTQFWCSTFESTNLFESIKKYLSNTVGDDIAIISTKDESSIKDILYFYGVKNLKLPILGKYVFNEFKTKGKVIKNFLEYRMFPKDKHVLFIDDHAKHLVDFQTECNDYYTLSVEAAWGYTDEDKPEHIYSAHETEALNRIKQII